MTRSLSRAMTPAAVAFVLGWTDPAWAAFTYQINLPTPAPPMTATSPPQQPGGRRYQVNATLQDSVYALPIGYSFQDILNNCLAAQGSDWRVTGSFDLHGTLRLDDVRAWVETRPSYTFDGITMPSEPRPGKGGAGLKLTYIPGTDDPSDLQRLSGVDLPSFMRLSLGA